MIWLRWSSSDYHFFSNANSWCWCWFHHFYRVKKINHVQSWVFSMYVLQISKMAWFTAMFENLNSVFRSFFLSFIHSFIHHCFCWLLMSFTKKISFCALKQSNFEECIMHEWWYPTRKKTPTWNNNTLNRRNRNVVMKITWSSIFRSAENYAKQMY